MRLIHSTLLAALAACPAVLPLALTAPSPARAAEAHNTITIAAGSGRVLHLKAVATNIFTADPKVAEVRPASNDSLFVWGVAPGSTTIAALNNNGETVAQFQVVVEPSSYQSSQFGRSLSTAPTGPVHARETVSGLSLSGMVRSPRDAARAVAAAAGQLPTDGKIDNNLTVSEPVQVSLHVRVAEMNRTLVRELGVNWYGAGANGQASGLGTYGTAQLGKDVQTGISTNNPLNDTTFTPSSFYAKLFHNFNLETVIQALSDDQLVHLLAEPNLTTMSGEPANFLVGGEFPVPVATNANTISVEFKQYGISLAFVPTVLAHGAINLHVRPEVSQLDKANGVTFFFGTQNSSAGLSIPGLDVRRADTTVQLGSGQSFVIAGLLQDQTTLTGNAIPGLGDVPVLGALFRSDSFQRNQSELVIIVTPYIVKPVNDPNALHAPTDGWTAPTDIERILYFRQSGPGYAGIRAAHHIPADAGFMVE